MVPKSVFGKKSAQVTTQININWLRDALGGAWGRTKKHWKFPWVPDTERVSAREPLEEPLAPRGGLARASTEEKKETWLI